ncbi:hypothetical protein Ddc_22529 [Ditylenchus destructor]|nr:hypothetical protein Ddc_22529 [Ditylenchus destructor]
MNSRYNMDIAAEHFKIVTLSGKPYRRYTKSGFHNQRCRLSRHRCFDGFWMVIIPDFDQALLHEIKINRTNTA